MALVSSGGAATPPDNNTIKLNASNLLSAPSLLGPLWVNVKDPAYGAVGDGTADDTVAIQAAITAAGNYGEVFFPTGSYKVTDQGSGFCLDISSISGLSLIGETGNAAANPSATGGSATIFTSSASTKIVKAEPGALNHRGPLVKNLRLEDRGSSATCFSLGDFNNFRFEGVTFHGAGGSITSVGLSIVSPTDASYGLIRDCQFHRLFEGLDTTGGVSVGFRLEGACYFETNTTNAILANLGAVSAQTLDGAKFEGNDTAGMIGVQIAAGAGDAIVNACSFEGCTTGVKLLGPGSPAYTGALVSSCSFVGSNATETGINIGANRQRDQIIGCRYSNLSVNISDSSPTDGTGAIILGTRTDAARTDEFMRVSNVSLFVGSGAPTVSAPLGSIWLRTDGTTGTTFYINQSGSTTWTALGAGGNASWGVVTATYSASITPAVGSASMVKITATDTNAFTINNPTGGTAGQRVVFVIQNSSGGTLGNVTWGGAFSTNWSNASNKPANGHHTLFLFTYDGTTWLQTPVTDIA